MQLRQSLECPVCYHVRRGDIFQCKTGHLVCGSCYSKLPANLCPLARCGFDNPPRHNLAVEQIVAGGGVAIDCDNADHGCVYKGVGQELEEHLPECPHRKVPCPQTVCQKRICLNKLDRHFATSPNHGVICATRPFGHYIELPVSEARKFELMLMSPPQKKGVTFYHQMVVREGTWFAWVKVKGGAREAGRWSCSVSVKGISATDQQVHPIDRTVEEVLESGQYLALTKQQARSIAKPDGAGRSRLLKYLIGVKYLIAEKEDEESEEESEKESEEESEEESDEEEEMEEA